MKNTSKRFSITHVLIAASLLVGTLSGCGGGGGGGTNAAGNTVSPTAHVAIGGWVTGLAANEQVTLLNNGTNAQTVSANGAFTFSELVPANGSYAVTIGTQPTGKICSVTGGTGSGSGISTDVRNISITCSSITYTIGGTVTGLADGALVTLFNNGT